MYELTDGATGLSEINTYLSEWRLGSANVKITPGGLRHGNQWGCLRYCGK